MTELLDLLRDRMSWAGFLAATGIPGCFALFAWVMMR